MLDLIASYLKISGGAGGDSVQVDDTGDTGTDDTATDDTGDTTDTGDTASVDELQQVRGSIVDARSRIEQQLDRIERARVPVV